MKQMQEKMNDPEFKKLMESNPQIKASMEAAMKMQQGGGIESMMPKGVTLKIKGDKLLSHTEGGAIKAGAAASVVVVSAECISVSVERSSSDY